MSIWTNFEGEKKTTKLRAWLRFSDQLWPSYQRVGKCWTTCYTPSPIIPLSPAPPTQSVFSLNLIVSNRTDTTELFSLGCVSCIRH